MRTVIRCVLTAILVGVALVAVALTGAYASADAPNCATLQARIDTHNADRDRYDSEVAALNAAGGGEPWQVAKYNSWKARIDAEAAALNAEKETCFPSPKTNEEYAAQANNLGYKQRIPAQQAPFDSHGEAVYSNGDKYITRDNTSHNVSNGWKMFDRKGRRIGTYNWDLSTKVGK
ncbi:hypothetical protein ACFYUD_24110 [Nocardia tengchongensis]|uniref:hypothetical protein n=1 Tax=Nocardia tengchongensis TaxID=2055889 RepID=UPI0036CEB947